MVKKKSTYTESVKKAILKYQKTSENYKIYKSNYNKMRYLKSKQQKNELNP